MFVSVLMIVVVMPAHDLLFIGTLNNYYAGVNSKSQYKAIPIV